MFKLIDILSGKFWWLVFGIVIILASLFAATLLLPTPSTQACIDNSRTKGKTKTIYYDMGVLADSAAKSVDDVMQTMVASAYTAGCGGKSMASTVYRGGQSAGNALQTSASAIGQGIGNGALNVARGLGQGLAFIIYIPATILGTIADTPVVSAVIKPATLVPVPVIGYTLSAATTAAPAIANTANASAVDNTPTWPIHGVITTYFGVPHWPYQPTHTGIDISDGQRPGVTPVRPFKPGRVIDVVHSNSGLGNHVVIDHGDGLTSLYGHMSSTSVKIGQIVDKTTVLGLEGSTGVSTGTHLHFEIRVNGVLKDPRLFISSPL
jgi:hypothetical protein